MLSFKKCTFEKPSSPLEFPLTFLEEGMFLSGTAQFNKYFNLLALQQFVKQSDCFHQKCTFWLKSSHIESF